MKILIATSSEDLGRLIKQNVDVYIGCESDICEIDDLERDTTIDAKIVILEINENIESTLNILSENGKDAYVIVQSNDVELLKEVLALGGRGLVTIDDLEEDIKGIALVMKNIKPLKREENIKPQRKSLRAMQRSGLIGSEQEQVKDIRSRQNESKGLQQIRREAPMKVTKTARENSRVMPTSIQSLPSGHQIIVVYSPKGGVGKTTLSTSIAAHYAQSQNPRMNVVLVDLDVDFGNVHTKLRIKPSTTILDWIENKQMDDLQNYLVDHPSGIKILPAPANPADEGAVTDIVVQKVLNVLARRFDMVVVDVGPILRDSTIIACDMASKIYMVATPDLVDLKDVHKAVACFKDLGIDLAKTKLVINKMPKRAPLRMSEITDVIPLQIATVIPNDDGVLIESNRGEIPILGRRAKQYNSSMQKLFDDILLTGSVSKVVGGLFRWIKK